MLRTQQSAYLPENVCADIWMVTSGGILAVGGGIEANKLLMLARSESKQI